MFFLLWNTEKIIKKTSNFAKQRLLPLKIMPKDYVYEFDLISCITKLSRTNYILHLIKKSQAFKNRQILRNEIPSSHTESVYL